MLPINRDDVRYPRPFLED